MTAEGLVRELCEESSCPICLAYFRDPVILCCGHNFCQACITQYWGASDAQGAASCPECRKPLQPRDAWPNWQLANVVRLVQKLHEEKRAEGRWFVCEKHQRPLKFFCKDDQDSLCVVCKRTKHHEGHSIVPVEVIAQEYKEKIKAQLKSFEEERDKLVNWKTAPGLGSQEHMTSDCRCWCLHCLLCGYFCLFTLPALKDPLVWVFETVEQKLLGEDGKLWVEPGDSATYPSSGKGANIGCRV